MKNTITFTEPDQNLSEDEKKENTTYHQENIFDDIIIFVMSTRHIL
jgi:hypothetical protein